jgi:hypothetical protein
VDLKPEVEANIPSPLACIQHPEGGAGRYSATLFTAGEERDGHEKALVRAATPLVINLKQTPNPVLRVGLTFSQTGDLDRVEVFVDERKPATHRLDLWRMEGAHADMGPSPNISSTSTADATLPGNSSGVLPRGKAFGLPRLSAATDRMGWLAFVSRLWAGSGNMAVNIARLAESAADKPHKLIVVASPISGTPAVFEIPFRVLPVERPFLRRLAVRKANPGTACYDARWSLTNTITGTQEAMVSANERLEAGEYEAVLEFNRGLVSTTLSAPLDSRLKMEGTLVAMNVVDGTSSVWKGSIRVEASKGTEKVRLKVRGRDEAGLNIFSPAPGTTVFTSAEVRESPEEQDSDEYHELTVNVVVADQTPPVRQPNPSDPSNKFAKPPTDPKDLIKNGSNKDRLLGYMPHRPIAGRVSRPRRSVQRLWSVQGAGSEALQHLQCQRQEAG